MLKGEKSGYESSCAGGFEDAACLEAFPGARDYDVDAARVEYRVEVEEDFEDAWGGGG